MLGLTTIRNAFRQESLWTTLKKPPKDTLNTTPSHLIFNGFKFGWIYFGALTLMKAKKIKVLLTDHITLQLYDITWLYKETHNCSLDIHLTFTSPTPSVGSHIRMAVWEWGINVGLRGREMPACCVRVARRRRTWWRGACPHVRTWVWQDGCDFLHVPRRVCDKCICNCLIQLWNDYRVQ